MLKKNFNLKKLLSDVMTNRNEDSGAHMIHILSVECLQDGEVHVNVVIFCCIHLVTYSDGDA